jgi:hypothetical protein
MDPVYLYGIYVGLLFFAVWVIFTPSFVGSVIGAAVVFLFACVPYLFMIVGIDTMGCCDPTEGLILHFMRVGFSERPFVFTVIVLWILLGLLLIPPVVRRTSSGHAAWWESFGAFVLFPLSLLSIFYALSLYNRYHGWAIAMPILLPPLIGLYGIWVRFPHAMHRADVTNAVVWGAIYVLALAPFPLSFLDARTYPERLPERTWTRDFRRLTPDSTLLDYLLFRPDQRPEDWFEGVRRVKSRQADAEKLLKEGRLSSESPTRYGDIYELWRFDLKATPSLCEAFRQELRKETAQIDRPLSETGYPVHVIYLQLGNINWLASANCDLSDTLTDIQTKLIDIAMKLRATGQDATSRCLREQVSPGGQITLHDVEVCFRGDTFDRQIIEILNTLATLRQTH